VFASVSTATTYHAYRGGGYAGVTARRASSDGTVFDAGSHLGVRSIDKTAYFYMEDYKQCQRRKADECRIGGKKSAV
jgi:hypothetical protein